MENEYGWVITNDVVSDGEDNGVMGPRKVKYTKEEIKSKGVQFKMFDDDGELYYVGYLLGGDGFEPLDDFGEPNAGATEIQLRNTKTGRFETV